MIIIKTFHFYAAHRNQNLEDKCFNLHGHQYNIKCYFIEQRIGPSESVTTLFEEFEQIQVHLQAEWDHGMIIDKHDPLYNQLLAEEPGKNMKFKTLPFVSSVENICFTLFTEITNLGFKLIQLDVQETSSSVISYNLKDYEADAIERMPEEHEVLEVVADQCSHIFNEKMLCIHCGTTQFAVRMERKHRKRETQQIAKQRQKEIREQDIGN